MRGIEIDEAALADDYFLPRGGERHTYFLRRHRFRPHWVVAGIPGAQLESSPIRCSSQINSRPVGARIRQNTWMGVGPAAVAPA